MTRTLLFNASFEIVEWPVPDAFQASSAVANRNLLARKYRACDPERS